MGINETGMSRDVNSENKSRPREKVESKEGGKTFLERAKKYMPAWERPTLKATIEAGVKVATGLLAAQVAFSGISRAEGVSTPEASDTPLALRGGKDLTDRTSSSLVASEQRAKVMSESLRGPYVPPESFSSYKGPAVKDIWRNAHKEYVEGVEGTPEGLHQGEAQGRDDGKTVLDFRSRKVTPGGETARIRNRYSSGSAKAGQERKGRVFREEGDDLARF